MGAAPWMMEAPAAQALGRGKEDRDEREGRGERRREASPSLAGSVLRSSGMRGMGLLP